MLYITETQVNATEGYVWSEGEPYETFTSETGDLFLSLQQEYGRCISKMYIDTADGTAKHIGWVFQKRMRYSDSKATYLNETWVRVWKALPGLNAARTFKGE
jgi:hypothetical protein